MPFATTTLWWLVVYSLALAICVLKSKFMEVNTLRHLLSSYKRSSSTRLSKLRRNWGGWLRIWWNFLYIKIWVKIFLGSVYILCSTYNIQHCYIIYRNQPKEVFVQRRPLVRNTFDPNTCWHLWSLLVLHPEKRRMFIMGLHMCKYFNSILHKSSWVAWVISEFGKNVKNSHYKELAGNYCFFSHNSQVFFALGIQIFEL